MENQILLGTANAEQIEAWKKAHGKVFSYTVDGKIAYLRSVDRELYARAAVKINISPAKFNEVIVDGVWLGGDDSIKKDDGLYFGLTEFTEQLLNKKKGEMAEL